MNTTSPFPTTATPAAAPPERAPGKAAPLRVLPVPITLLGIPFDLVTTADTLRLFGQMIDSRRPHYAATANVDFCVQALGDMELRRILAHADLVVCDGQPLVWASRFLGNPIPERVAGSDIVPQLLAEAEQRGWRVFFLGGTTESVARAADNARAKHPWLQLVGSYSPPFEHLIEMDHADIARRVREARPDILLVAFGCPKQEKWIGMHFRDAGVPVSIGVGATIDFIAGSVKRAPSWMRRTGLEWVFRLLQEPRRLFRRYALGLRVFGFGMLRQWWVLGGFRHQTHLPNTVSADPFTREGVEVVRFAERLDAPTVKAQSALWSRIALAKSHLALDVSRILVIDSTGLGLLMRLHSQLTKTNRQLVLIAPSPALRRGLDLMAFSEFFSVASDLPAACALIKERIVEENVVTPEGPATSEGPLVWQGEINAATAEEVLRVTRLRLDRSQGSRAPLNINLAGVRFLDSSGVGLMVRLRKEASACGIPLRFTNPSPAVQNVLRVLRMERLLQS